MKDAKEQKPIAGYCGGPTVLSVSMHSTISKLLLLHFNVAKEFPTLCNNYGRGYIPKQVLTLV
jgi:hypothetical protein